MKDQGTRNKEACVDIMVVVVIVMGSDDFNRTAMAHCYTQQQSIDGWKVQ